MSLTVAEQLFRNTPDLRLELETILNGKTMQKALAILEDACKPRRSVPLTPGVPMDSSVSHHYHTIMGIQKAIDRLWRLTTPPTEGNEEKDPEDTEETFFHGLPEEMKQAIRQLKANQQA